MIKSLKVEGLNEKFNFDFKFHNDINIFTGKNGSGKTTLLKLLWYLNSGNIQQMFKEIPFDSIEFQSNTIESKLEITCKEERKYVKGFYTTNAYSYGAEKPVFLYSFEGKFIEHTKFERNLFFPTFRRIEGGYSIEDNKENFDSIGNNYFHIIFFKFI